MVLLLTDTISLSFTTIAGANMGFEIITTKDFAKTALAIKWAFMVSLFAIRLTLTKYHAE